LNSVNLTDVFVGMSSRWPDRKAIVSPNVSLTFSQLASRAAQSARELRLRGIGAGANVGVGIRDNPETVVLIIALWMLGATAVPIDFRTKAAGRNLLAREFDLNAIIEDRELPAAGYESILIDSTWADLIAGHDGTPIWRHEHLPPAAALISLTSGTTGRPLGIVLDHERALFRYIYDPSQRFGTSLLNPLSLSFSASFTHTLSALLHGSAVHFHPVLFSTEELAEAIRAWEVTSVCGVPTIIRNMLKMVGERSVPLFERLDAFYCFGAPMFAEEKCHAKRILCDNLVQEYGSSMSGRISSLSGADLVTRPDTVGRVLPYVALQVVDGDDKVLPSGEVGVLRVRSPAMARTIHGEARNLGDKLRGGWAYPGDIGALGDDGFLQLVGRASDLIIRGGANVHPAEVEGVIAKHRGVQDVAVIGFTKLPEGEEIAAFVVPSPNLTEADIVAHCIARLGPDKRPRKFVFVPDLPRNANGKIMRAELRRQLENPD
jgi:long-chain acyl-CoA synthetase